MAGSQLRKQLSLVDALSIVLGLIIGSGIYASGGSVLDHSGSVGSSLLMWVVGGLMVLLASLCYAELGTMYPNAGGEMLYLRKAYHPLLEYMFLWSSMVM